MSPSHWHESELGHFSWAATELWAHTDIIYSMWFPEYLNFQENSGTVSPQGSSLRHVEPGHVTQFRVHVNNSVSIFKLFKTLFFFKLVQFILEDTHKLFHLA